MPDSSSQPIASFFRSPRRIALAAFPVVLWLVATFALGGALGKSTDDYSTNLRDPVTGSAWGRFRPFAEFSYFGRPAHIVLVHGLQTFLDGHDRLIHGVSAAAHGVVALLLWGLLVRLTGRRAVSAWVSLAFVVVPIIHEGAFFTSFVSGPIASALWLWLAIAAVRAMQSPPATHRRARLWPMAVIALAIPFFYEQPGAGIFAFPLLIVAVLMGRPMAWRARLGWAFGLTGGLGLTQAAMAAALVWTAPGSKRGSPATLAPVGAWPARLAETLGAALTQLTGEPAGQVIRGGWALGWRTLTTTSLWVWLVPLMLTGMAWCLAWVGRPRDEEGEGCSRPPHATLSAGSSLLVCGFGVAAAAAGLAPAALVSGQNVAARMLYFPAIGLAIAGAGLLSAGASRLPAPLSRRLAAAGAPLIVGVVSLSAITMVGVQRQYQNRSSADRSIAEQLARLIPDPPADTVFVPVRLDAIPEATGMAHFDRVRPGAFETIWSATAITRQTHHRRDLWAAGWNPWRARLLEDPTDAGVRLNDRFVIWSPFANERAGGTRLPWSHVVPFVVERGGAGAGAGGRVRLVRRVVFESEDGTERAIQPPIVHRRVGGENDGLGRTETCVYRTIGDTPEDAGMTELPAWAWTATGADAEPQMCRAWPGPGNTRRAVWMHPSADSGGRASLTTTLPPCKTARRVVIRAAITEYDLNRHAASDPVTLALEVDGRPAATVTIRRGWFRAEQGWIPLIAEAPASTEPVRLQLTVRPAPLPPGGGGMEPKTVLDPVWVSTGLIGMGRGPEGERER